METDVEDYVLEDKVESQNVVEDESVVLTPEEAKKQVTM
jgi:hypothetical protein